MLAKNRQGEVNSYYIFLYPTVIMFNAYELRKQETEIIPEFSPISTSFSSNQNSIVFI